MFIGKKATFLTMFLSSVIAGVICAAAENILIWKFNIVSDTLIYFGIVASIIFAILFFLPFGRRIEFDVSEKTYFIVGLVLSPAIYFFLFFIIYLIYAVTSTPRWYGAGL